MRRWRLGRLFSVQRDAAALAGLAYFAFSWLVIDPHPLMRIGVETAAILLIVVTREAGIMLLWSALKRRIEFDPG